MMKNIALLLAFFALTITTRGATTVHIMKGNTGVKLWLIGIFETDTSFLPVAFAHQWGGGFTVISVESITTELEFPTILLDSPSWQIPSGIPIYIQGEVTPHEFNLNEKEWIHSRYLGWTHVSNYPTVYSPDNGWLYINQAPSGQEIYHVYSYRNNSWETYDLRGAGDSLNTYLLGNDWPY